MALVSADFGCFGSDRISWCVAPGRNGVRRCMRGNDVSTLLCPPAIFHCPRVDNGGTLTRHSAGFGLVAVHAFLRCMAPRGHGAAKQRFGVPTEEWTPDLEPKKGTESPSLISNQQAL